VAEGHTDVEVTGTERRDEMGSLARALAVFLEALVGFRGDGERAQATSASIKEPSKAFPRLRAL
jgi:hypothetical protein